LELKGIGQAIMGLSIHSQSDKTFRLGLLINMALVIDLPISLLLIAS
jgi:hypothetical protein